MTAPLLERDAELAVLDAAIGSLASGSGRPVIIEGPAGIGKTRLVAAVRERAAGRGVGVLSARGGEMERDFPFGVVRQLLEAQVTGPGGEALLAGAASAARPALSAPPEDAGAPHDGSFAVLHGLYWVVVNLASAGPVVMTIDDLHWCDRPSLRALAYLTRRLDGLPVLLVGCLRPSEPGTDEALIADLVHDPAVIRVRPGALGPQAAAALLSTRLGTAPDPALAAACHDATGGNPLLLSELASAMAIEGPGGGREAEELVRSVGPRAVSRAVLGRLARLSGRALPVARAVAVLGDGAGLPAVAALAGIPRDEAATAVAALARADILGPEPPLGFVHPLVRDAVYTDLPLGDREDWHARAARLLADAGEPDERVAAHLLLSPPRGDPATAALLVRAADMSLSRGAAEGAVAYLTRALAEPPAQGDRAALLLRLGECEGYLTGTRAAGHLRAAFRAAEDPALRARAAVALAQTLQFVGDPGEADAVTREALASPGLDPDLRDRLRAGHLCTALYDPSILPLDADDFRRHRTVGGDGTGARMLAGIAAYQWAVTGGPAAECVPLALHAVGGEALWVDQAVSVPTIAGVIVLTLAGHEAAGSATRTILDAAHRRGSAAIASGAYIFRGLVLWLRGDLEAADRHLRQARDVQDAWGHTTVRLFPAGYHAGVLIERGDIAGARAAMEWAGMPSDDALPRTPNAAWWLAARLRLLLAEGTLDEVVRLTDDLPARVAHADANPAWIPWRSLRAEALLRAGRREEAIGLLDAELAAAERWGAPGPVGRVLRLRGAARGGAAGHEDLTAAVEVLEGSGAALELAGALGALGTHLRLARRPTEARRPLRRALDLATSCAASPLAEHLRTELLAAGARPRTAALSGVASLTASERRVADLAAAGAGNREIAQELYVTPKTVEVHLSSAYRKLGIRSRRELASALAAG